MSSNTCNFFREVIDYRCTIPCSTQSTFILEYHPCSLPVIYALFTPSTKTIKKSSREIVPVPSYPVYPLINRGAEISVHANGETSMRLYGIGTSCPCERMWFELANLHINS